MKIEISPILLSELNGLLEKQKPLLHTFTKGVMLGPLSADPGKVLFMPTESAGDKRKATMEKLCTALRDRSSEHVGRVPRVFLVTSAGVILDNPFCLTDPPAVIADMEEAMA